MKFCSACGTELERRVPSGDDRPRFVCPSCAIVHYQNPKIVTGCLAAWEDSVLLCRRSIEPRRGYWTLPAGFLELGETSVEGAVRETWEEARARVEVLGLYSVFNLPHVDQLYLMFRARLLDLDFHPGPESEEVVLFREDEIPWEDLAFGTVRHSLKFFFRDRPKALFPVHTGTIVRTPDGFHFERGPDDQASAAGFT